MKILLVTWRSGGARVQRAGVAFAEEPALHLVSTSQHTVAFDAVHIGRESILEACPLRVRTGERRTETGQ